MQDLLRRLFELYHQELYAYFYSLCRSAPLAEDLTSEVFIQAVRSIRQYRGEGDPKAWLFGIARHCWYRHLRQKQRQPQTELLGE